MIQYFDDYDVACVDGRSFRLDKKTGYYLSSKKIGERRKRLHVYIWEREHGPVPKGYSVHHIDENKRNNEIDNLTIMTSEEHAQLHGETMDWSRRTAAAKRVVENAMPKAREWHGSDAGYVWHSKHMKETMAKLAPVKYTCTYCGKEFETKHRYGSGEKTFCSNSCKSAFRRASGVDNVTKVCERCGNEYTANKYQKTKYCENCKNRKSGN